MHLATTFLDMAADADNDTAINTEQTMPMIRPG